MAAARHRSSATPLALAYAALVLYASLYPFTGWRWPPGQTLATMGRAGLAAVARRIRHLVQPAGLPAAGRPAADRGAAQRLCAWCPRCCWRCWAPALLSYVLEVLQHFVAGRHPSLKDLAMNSAGAVCGALLALAVRTAVGLVDRWQHCANAGSRATAPARWRCWRCGRSACCSRRRCPSAWARWANGCARRWPAGCRTCPGPTAPTPCWPRRRRRRRR